MSNNDEGVPLFLILKNRRGFWGFPQGHKERGESDVQTLSREVEEETGIENINIISFIGTIRYYYFKQDGMKSHKEVKFYFATSTTKEIIISNEHESYKWVTFDDVLDILSHRQLRIIFFKGRRRGLY